MGKEGWLELNLHALFLIVLGVGTFIFKPPKPKDLADTLSFFCRHNYLHRFYKPLTDPDLKVVQIGLLLPAMHFVDHLCVGGWQQRYNNTEPCHTADIS